MGSTTAKGYPYPVGTDRVMDGDDAIKALAQAVDDDARFSHALTVGQSIPGGTPTAVQWQAATENGCGLTKTSATVWTVTLAGIYVVSGVVRTGLSQTGRAFLDLWLGGQVTRGVFTSDSAGGITMVNRCVPGDIIRVDVFLTTAQSIPAGAPGGFLNVARVGRSTGATPPVGTLLPAADDGDPPE